MIVGVFDRPKKNLYDQNSACLISFMTMSNRICAFVCVHNGRSHTEQCHPHDMHTFPLQKVSNDPATTREPYIFLFCHVPLAQGQDIPHAPEGPPQQVNGGTEQQPGPAPNVSRRRV